MNYINQYKNLIFKAQNRTTLEGYFEEHHIIPRCLGGSNLEENLVKLTAKEHFIAHALLAHIFPNHQGVQLAFNMMRNCHSTITQSRYVSAQKYKTLKEYFSKTQSEFISKRNQGNKIWLGKNHTEETKRKISFSNVNSEYTLSGNKSIDTIRRNIGNTFGSGKQKTHEERARLKIQMTGNKIWLGKTHKLESIDKIVSSNANSEYTLSGQRSRDTSIRSIGNTYASNPIRVECVYCKELTTKSTITNFHGPTPSRGDPLTSKCKIKSLELKTSW